jgi:hypothetical protein
MLFLVGNYVLRLKKRDSTNVSVQSACQNRRNQGEDIANRLPRIATDALEGHGERELALERVYVEAV